VAVGAAFYRSLAWAVVVAIALPACAQSLESRFIDGLRQRRLFELAESYCTDRLSRAGRGQPIQAELTVELVRTLALHAASAPLDQRQALWRRSHEAAADLLRQSPPHPRAVLVRFQDALALLAQGEISRQEFETGTLRGDQVELARQALRQASSIFETLDKELKAEIPLRRRAAPRPGEPSADELTRLNEQVQHNMARADKSRALLFDRGSDDRLSLLLAATEILERLSAQVPEQESLQASIQLDLAECRRMLGRYSEATSSAAAVDREGAAIETRMAARAELLRSAIAQHDFSAAQRLMESTNVSATQASPELGLARLEALLAFSRAAAQGQRISPADLARPQEMAKIYQQQATEQVELLEKAHGPYWGRRASQLLLAALPRAAMDSAPLLARAADELYLKGELDQAIAAYDDAAAQAKAKGDFQAAFEQAYKAALAEQKRGAARAAANRLRVLANSFPTHRQAAQAHLLAIWNERQEAAKDSVAASLYEELLREHLTSWPTSESANQARLWLGKLMEGKADWPAAIEAYAAVSQASPHYAVAVPTLARAWREELNMLATGGRPTADAAGQAIRFFQRALLGAENRWPERWTDADRTAALTAADLIVAYQPGSSSDAENLIRRAIAGSFDASPAWRAAAQAQLVVAVAAQGGRQSDALAELRSIGTASADQMLAVLERLSQVAARSGERGRQQIAALQMEAAAVVEKHPQSLTPDQRLTLERVQAEALAGAGRIDQALVRYEQLARSRPDNGALQTGFATLLLSTSDAAQLKKALDQWRLVAGRTPPRTAPWFEAKYSVALAQFKLGDQAGAATLLRFMLETPPGMHGSEWEAKFTDLLKKCGP
jgi:hypothetical protein